MTAPPDFEVGDLIQFHHVHDRNAGAIYRIDQVIRAKNELVLGFVFSIGSQIKPGFRHEYLRDTDGFYALQPTKVGTADKLDTDTQTGGEKDGDSQGRTQEDHPERDPQADRG